MIESQTHQLLHGYRSGHVQIAGSVRLEDRDSDLVTRLSDLSGSLSSGIKFNSYLTVYRLPSRTFFALARTWPDPDASRAGCVITHTVLVPIDEWSSLPNVRSINRLFQNPRSSPTYDFGTPLRLSLEETVRPSTNIEVDPLASQMFISRYFGKGLRPVVWFNASEPEEFLWRLLQHLWPKLRAAFSCCTFSLQQRTLEDGPFDLLFAPSLVYSRFSRLPADQLIGADVDGKASETPLEPWCQYWAQALFSSQSGLPSKESELPLWNELGEDPTAIRKLSLVHDLRLRATQSPIAGVGAIDVVESLARDPEVALILKRQVFADAIQAAAAAHPADEALTSLRLIGDRLLRESFRDIAADFDKRLSSAAAQVTVRDPEAALQAGGTWLTDSFADGKSAFAHGVMIGLRELATDNPLQLVALRSHPDVAAELFRLVPTFGATYLQFGGESARRVLADWLTSTRDMETLRFVRKSVLPSLRWPDDQEILAPLLRDLRSDEVEATLSVLFDLGIDLSNQAIQSIVVDQISSAYPELTRQWAATTPHWSTAISEIVASTYPPSRHGFNQILEQKNFDSTRQAEVLAAMLRTQLTGSSPYWLRELVSEDDRFIRTLLLVPSSVSDAIEAALSRLLAEIPDLPLAKSGEILTAVLKFEGRPAFPQLLDSTMRRVISSYVADGADSADAQEFVTDPIVLRWFQNISDAQLAALLVRSSSSGPDALARAWKWISEAPQALYKRCPSILLGICDSLLPSVRKSFPEGVETSFIRLLRRSSSEADAEVRLALSGRMMRFAFDNVRLPLGSVVAEAFADVYSIAVENTRQPSFLFSLFSSQDWDKGKELRISLVDAFFRSNWAPGDLAIAANNAGILRKIVKRLHRKPKGDQYIVSMARDLAGRSNPNLTRLTDNLKSLVADLDFYEEWD